MIRSIILKSFDESLDEIFSKNQNILNFLKNHERKNTCIDNLVAETTKVELSGRYILKKEDIEFIGKEYARTFSQMALRFEEEKAVSKLERQRRIKEADDFKEVSEMIQEIDRSESLDGN